MSVLKKEWKNWRAARGRGGERDTPEIGDRERTGHGPRLCFAWQRRCGGRGRHSPCFYFIGSAAPCTRLVVVVKKEVKPRTMSSTAAEREKVGRFG